MMRSIKLSSFVLCLLLVTACGKPEPKAPYLMTAQQHMSGVVEGSGTGGYADITSKIAALPQDVYGGTDVSFMEKISNQGAPSKGVRVKVQGSALDILSAPKTALIKSDESEEPLEFSQEGGSLVATATKLSYTKDLSLVLSFTGLKNGEGDLQVFVYPLDKAGKTTVVFNKHYRVLSEQDQPSADNSIEVPTD